MSSLESLAALTPSESIHEHRLRTRKMRWWYEALADFMLAHPSATQNEIAAHFGRAVSTISTVVNTDAFKAYLRARRAEYHATLNEAVKTRLLNVAEKSLDAILEKLEKKRDTLPLDVLNRTTESTLRALGYGQSASPSVVVNNNPGAPAQVAVTVSLDDLEAARAALRHSQQQALAAPTVVDVTPNSAEGGARQESSAPGGLGRGAPLSQED